MEKNEKLYHKLTRAVRPVLERRYGEGEARRLMETMEPIYDRFLANPEGHDHGFAMTLVGCPIADFAKEHGYMDVMPILCESDHRTAAALHAKLIRRHTVAQGADSCDYWYVGENAQ